MIRTLRYIDALSVVENEETISVLTSDFVQKHERISFYGSRKCFIVSTVYKRRDGLYTIVARH